MVVVVVVVVCVGGGSGGGVGGGGGGSFRDDSVSSQWRAALIRVRAHASRKFVQSPLFVLPTRLYSFIMIDPDADCQ